MKKKSVYISLESGQLTNVLIAGLSITCNNAQPCKKNEKIKVFLNFFWSSFTSVFVIVAHSQREREREREIKRERLAHTICSDVGLER